MSEHNHAQEHSHTNYVKIWGILLGLLVVSVAGPMLEMPVITLIAAFGIAIVKALMVAAYFMHLNVEKKYIWYLLITCVVLMLLLFFFVAPDVLNHQGSNWIES
jgi:caa(3)-type oxidase subunit IV